MSIQYLIWLKSEQRIRRMFIEMDIGTHLTCMCMSNDCVCQQVHYVVSKFLVSIVTINSWGYLETSPRKLLRVFHKRSGRCQIDVYGDARLPTVKQPCRSLVSHNSVFA
jgi:hypothetical protein